jgi:hypothetical protein
LREYEEVLLRETDALEAVERRLRLLVRAGVMLPTIIILTQFLLTSFTAGYFLEFEYIMFLGIF